MTQIALLLLAAALQQPPPPPPPPPPMRAPARDAGPVLKGTSVLKGRVHTAEGRPLRRVQVRLTGPGLGQGITVATGLEGEYEITELPAGRFNLEFTRPGYLPYKWGQRYFGEPGTPIDVPNAATLEKMDAVMVRGGVITGRVTDETGEPISGVDMWPMQWQVYRGRKQLVPVATGLAHIESDDIGQYRIPALPPGDYVVVGRLRETWMSDEKEPRMLAYAPTYFPGTASPAEAARVRVGAGQEVAGIDMTLLAVRAARISGTAMATDGRPMTGGSLILMQEIMGPQGGRTGMAGSGSIGADGTWRLTDVPPGDYRLQAFGTVAGGGREAASLPITITGADLEGITLVADAGALITGRVTTDTGGPLPGGNLFFSTASLYAVRTSIQPTAGKDDGAIGPDGRFVRRSFSGSVVARLLGLPRGWSIKQVVIDGRDYAGLPIELRSGQQIAGVAVVITQAFPAVAGTVAGADGKPTPEATVLLYSVDPARWHEAAANQRIGRPDQSGRYRLESVRPGEYFIIALETMQQWQMNDPDFLNELKERAEKIVVREAEALTVDLKVQR